MVSNPSRKGLKWTFSLEKGLNPGFKTMVSNPSTKGFQPIRMVYFINLTLFFKCLISKDCLYTWVEYHGLDTMVFKP